MGDMSANLSLFALDITSLTPENIRRGPSIVLKTPPWQHQRSFNHLPHFSHEESVHWVFLFLAHLVLPASKIPLSHSLPPTSHAHEERVSKHGDTTAQPIENKSAQIPLSPHSTIHAVRNKERKLTGVILSTHSGSRPHSYSLTRATILTLISNIANFSPKQALEPPWKLINSALAFAFRYLLLMSSFVTPHLSGINSSASGPHTLGERLVE